jgi:phenylacetate-CoA ligase
MDRLLGRRRFSLGDSPNSDHVLAKLDYYEPEYIYGYTSALVDLATRWSASGRQLKRLRAVISTAEVLQPFQRRILESAFGCPVINEYGCSELDIIACSCAAGTMHVAPANVLVESVQYSDAHELVLTGLESRLMPLIRYRVGDIGRVSWVSCSCGKSSLAVDGLDGRTSKQMVFLPDGRKRHCAIFNDIIDSLPPGLAIRKFRVAQEAIDRFHFYLDCERSVPQQALLEMITDKTVTALKFRPQIELTIGPIPNNPAGKFTDFVALDATSP